MILGHVIVTVTISRRLGLCWSPMASYGSTSPGRDCGRLGRQYSHGTLRLTLSLTLRLTLIPWLQGSGLSESRVKFNLKFGGPS